MYIAHHTAQHTIDLGVAMWIGLGILAIGTTAATYLLLKKRYTQ